MIIAPFLCDLRIDEDGGMKIQMMSFLCRGHPPARERSNESSNHQSSAIVQPALPSLVPDGIGPAGFVGGPFGGRVGVFGSPVDTLGVRGYGERHDGKRQQNQKLNVVAGWGSRLDAAVSCFWYRHTGGVVAS